MTMTEPIRIFYLDDYPLDRAQVRDALQQEPGVYELTEAGNAAEFESLLKDGKYDLVLSDFNILGFTGFQALEKVQEIAPRLPVIILTGTGSEEVAAEAIKRGAADYIVKNTANIRRLPRNIQLILVNKRAEENRREIEEKYHLLVKQAADGIFLADKTGRFVDVNPSGCGMVGFTRDELLNMSMRDMIGLEETVRDPVHMKEFTSGNPLRSERNLVRKDGSLLPVEISAWMLPDGSLQGIVRDISERKRLEELLLQNETIFKAFMEFSPIHVFFKDRETRALRLSQNYEQMLGIPVSQALGKTMDDLFPSELAKSMVAADLRILKEGKKVDVIEELNGRYYETTKFPIFRDGKPEMLAGFTVDITERKLAEQAMRKNEIFNQAVIQNSPIGITVRSRTGGLLSVNPAWKAIWAVPDDEIQKRLQHQPEKLKFDSHDGYLRSYQEDVRRVYEQGGSLYLPELKIAHPRPSGAEWVAQHFYAILDDQGQVDRVIILTEDISPRKRAEMEINRSRVMLERVQEVAHLGSFEINLNTKLITASPEAHRIYGVEEVTMTLASVQSMTLPEYRPMLDAALSALISRGEKYDVELKIKRLNSGEVRDIHSIAEYNAEENTVIGSIQDITERKQVEQAILESEAKFRSLFEGAQDAIHVEDENDQIVDANQRAYEMLGYSREEFLKLKVSDLQAPEARGRAGNVLKDEIERFGSKVFESVDLCKDGTRIPVEVSVSKISTLHGNLYISIVRDISERKRVEQELKDQIDILERINNVTVDRELRMLELKKEINALLVKAGGKEKYRIFDL
jgi:PAS domain S-box-containing protein